MRPEHFNCRCVTVEIIESGAFVTSRVVGVITDQTLYRITSCPKDVDFVAEAKRRYPYCDLRMYRDDFRAAWTSKPGATSTANLAI